MKLKKFLVTIKDLTQTLIILNQFINKLRVKSKLDKNLQNQGVQ